jgi:hypothetical protein
VAPPISPERTLFGKYLITLQPIRANRPQAFHQVPKLINAIKAYEVTRKDKGLLSKHIHIICFEKKGYAQIPLTWQNMGTPQSYNYGQLLQRLGINTTSTDDTPAPLSAEGKNLDTNYIAKTPLLAVWVGGKFRGPSHRSEFVPLDRRTCSRSSEVARQDKAIANAEAAMLDKP